MKSNWIKVVTEGQVILSCSFLHSYCRNLHMNVSNCHLSKDYREPHPILNQYIKWCHDINHNSDIIMLSIKHFRVITFSGWLLLIPSVIFIFKIYCKPVSLLSLFYGRFWEFEGAFKWTSMIKKMHICLIMDWDVQLKLEQIKWDSFVVPVNIN